MFSTKTKSAKGINASFRSRLAVQHNLVVLRVPDNLAALWA